MTATELVKQLVLLRPAVVLCIAMTLLAFCVMQGCIRGLRARGPGTKLAGLFLGLGGRSALMLAAAWLKCALLASVLLLAQPAQLGHYLLIIGLALLILVLHPSLGGLLSEALGGGLMAAGLYVCTSLLQYLRQVRYDPTIRAAYWMLAVFLILCAVGVLLREVTELSGERTYFDETGETE